MIDGEIVSVNGTSASSPIFASVLALINDELLHAGKPVLGFINPFLYANAEAFNDITTGTAACPSRVSLLALTCF